MINPATIVVWHGHQLFHKQNIMVDMQKRDAIAIFHILTLAWNVHAAWICKFAQCGAQDVEL